MESDANLCVSFTTSKCGLSRAVLIHVGAGPRDARGKLLSCRLCLSYGCSGDLSLQFQGYQSSTLFLKRFERVAVQVLLSDDSRMRLLCQSLLFHLVAAPLGAPVREAL